MMWRTKKLYDAICDGTADDGAALPRRLPRSGARSTASATRGSAAFMLACCRRLISPSPRTGGCSCSSRLHWTLGARCTGRSVNWCGHRYGYRNFNNDDDFANTLALDLVTLGGALPEQPPPSAR